jgi:hypothetical protein
MYKLLSKKSPVSKVDKFYYPQNKLKNYGHKVYKSGDVLTPPNYILSNYLIPRHSERFKLSMVRKQLDILSWPMNIFLKDEIGKLSKINTSDF